MSAAGNPNEGFWWKFTLTPGYFEALQAMSQEVLAREMKNGDQPSRSLQAIAGYSSDAPFFRTRSPENVNSIAEHLAAFARDTDNSITNLCLNWPAELAAPLVAERMKHGELAKELSDVLFADAQYVQLMSEETTSVEDWANHLLD